MSEAVIRIIASDESRIDPVAIDQLHQTAALEGIDEIVGLPDLHAGRGIAVGAAFWSGCHVHPHLVGSDIGCGMGLWETETAVRKFIGLKRHAIENAPYYKTLNENLAPLVRFIRKQVGRPWDDVFSEICAHLDTGSTVKMHVRTHLKDFVMIRISRGRNGELIHDGRVIEANQRDYRWVEFYVDPDDGVLKDRATFWRGRGQKALPKKHWRNPHPKDAAQ